MERVTFRTTLGQIAEHVRSGLAGDPATIITGASSIELAGEGDLSFINHPSYLKYLNTTRATALLVKHGVAASHPALLRVENPVFAFVQVLNDFCPASSSVKQGIHPAAVLASDVELGSGTNTPYLLPVTRS